ncbi:MAG: hypothetical protein Q9M50_06100 [Methylococcales bacterium]|nr:hypothetical protein [Methylococcales bacterium]
MKILIVLHDTILLTTFKIWLHNYSKTIDDVILVSHFLEGREILKKHQIDVIIMDLEVEKFDGFDLLLLSIKSYPTINMIILSDSIVHTNPFFSSFNCLKKSSSLNQLKCLLTSIRKKELDLKVVNRILIADFFRLLQMKRKTCLIEITVEKTKGFIYFYQGELFNSVYGGDKGEVAFLKILDHKCDNLSFRSIPERSFARVITTSLLGLIKKYIAQKNAPTIIEKTNTTNTSREANNRDDFSIAHKNKRPVKSENITVLENNEEDEALVITEGLVELTEIEVLPVIKQATLSKENKINSLIGVQEIKPLEVEIKVLDRVDEKGDDNTVIKTDTSILEDKIEVVFEKSQIIGKENMALQDCLTPLQDIDGYLASAIFDMSGEVLVQHNNSKYNVSLIGANAISMINSAIKAMNGAGLGKYNFIQVNSERGIFGAVWAVEDQSVVAVLLEPNANVGMAKLLLAKVGETSGSQLS